MKKIRPSFPTEEQTDPEYIRTSVDAGTMTVIACEEYHIDHGVAFLSQYDNAQNLFLDYLAVFPESQSNGVGTALVRHILDSHPESIVFAEIENPQWVQEDMREDAERRWTFYSRLGAHLAVQEYYIPRLAPDKDRAKMTLIALCRDELLPVTPEDVVEIVQATYQDAGDHLPDGLLERAWEATPAPLVAGDYDN